MSNIFNETGIRFEFGNSWKTVKYDDHSDYVNGIQKLKHPTQGRQKDTTAVDFISVSEMNLVFIEVKNFRGHRIENEPRVGADLAYEVAFKTRDSIAGIVSAFHTSSNLDIWEEFADALTNMNKSIMVLLWLEEDARFPSQEEHYRHKHRTSVLIQELKKACNWLTPRAFVVNLEDFNNLLPDLQVSNLPRARNQ